jgi:hypothetical protein
MCDISRLRVEKGNISDVLLFYLVIRDEHVFSTDPM